MIERVNPDMIVLAREMKGANQAALAELIGVNQATISRYEDGTLEVTESHLERMAETLERPPSFFYWREKLYDSSCLYHRRRSRISVRDLKSVHAHVNILRIQASRLIREAQIQSDYQFHRLDMEKCGGPRDCAKRLRHLWQMPTGPVRSVMTRIESAGGLVFRCPFGSISVDGISQWPLDAPELPPVFFLNEESPGDRQRWTLCHEIGHVVMHHLPTDKPEEEANLFASEFLMPSDEISPELSRLTLQKAAALKAYWKVSMQAIIKLAHALERISENQYRYLFKQLSSRGYRRCEPVLIPAEEPLMMKEVLETHYRHHKKPVKVLSEFIGETEENFRKRYWHSLSGFRLVG